MLLEKELTVDLDDFSRLDSLLEKEREWISILSSSAVVTRYNIAVLAVDFDDRNDTTLSPRPNVRVEQNHIQTY